jgi:hypothetical protein
MPDTSSNSSNVISFRGRGREQERKEPSLRAQALTLQWFGQETISFNRGFAEITGNALCALWLSYVLDQMPITVQAGRGSVQGSEYTFLMTGQECEQATCITRAQQITCRKQLTQQGILSEHSGRGKTVHYTLHLDRLIACLETAAQPLLQALQQAQGSSQGRLAARGARG